jgi:hypothetical protein
MLAAVLPSEKDWGLAGPNLDENLNYLKILHSFSSSNKIIFVPPLERKLMIDWLEGWIIPLFIKIMGK